MNTFTETSGVETSPCYNSSTTDSPDPSTPSASNNNNNNSVSDPPLVSTQDAPSNHGNKLTLHLPNGTDFQNSNPHAASDLLKTIIIASQASAASQLSSDTSSLNAASPTKMERKDFTIPADLQNFKADPFTVEINGTNGHQQLLQQQQQQQQIQQIQQHIQQQQQQQQQIQHQQQQQQLQQQLQQQQQQQHLQQQQQQQQIQQQQQLQQQQQQQQFQQQLQSNNALQLQNSEGTETQCNANGTQNLNNSQLSPSAYVVQHSPTTDMANNSQIFNNVSAPTGSILECLTSPTIGSNQNNSDMNNSVKSENVMLHKGGMFSQPSGLPSFEAMAQLNAENNKDFEKENSSILEKILTRDSGMDASFHMSPASTKSVSSPEQLQNSPIGTSNSPPYRDHTSMSLMDTNHEATTYTEMQVPSTSFSDTTSASLITKSEKLSINTFHSLAQEEELKKLFEWNVTKIDDAELERIEVSRHAKVQKMSFTCETSSVLSPSVEKVFDADIGAGLEFKFSKFGQNEPFQFGTDELPSRPTSMELDKSSTQKTCADKEPSPVQEEVSHFHAPQPPSNLMSRKRDQVRRSKEPILCQHFPSKISGYELRILQQPEEQHRARYLTEGSRGSVKNRSGQGYPVVKLFGNCKEATLQVFIGCDTGRVRPHGFYQACKVCGKNSTQCVEKDIDGTTVIEIEMKAEFDMTSAIDCVGILKLRNADVEQRIGIAKAKKKSTKARMIFRVTFQKACGSPQVLQVASGPILCTQPVGHPEICRMSLKESPVSGGGELFIIGKNFLRGTRVYFQQTKFENEVVWETEGEIDTDFFQATHLIVCVPEYPMPLQSNEAACQVVIHSGGKVSDPQPFIYKQEDTKLSVKQEVPMDTVEESRKRNYPFVAPEALELNQQIQQSQGQQQGSSERFHLPPGIINGSIAKKTAMCLEEVTTNPAGVGFTSPTTPVESSTFSDSEREGLTTESFTLTPSKFGAESMSAGQTPAWDSSNDDSQHNCDTEVVHISDQEDSVIDDRNLDLIPSASSTLNESFSGEDVYSTFSSDKMSLTSSAPVESSPTVVDQFLKNVSMLKSTDPLLSSVPKSFNNTVLTQANDKTVLSSGLSPVFTTPVYAAGERSLLKEALTCPPSSLATINFGAPLSNNTQVVPSPSNSEVEMTEMESTSDTAMYTTDSLNLQDKSMTLSHTDSSGSLQAMALGGTSTVSGETAAALYIDREPTQTREPSNIVPEQVPTSPYMTDTYPVTGLSSGSAVRRLSLGAPVSVQEGTPVSPQVTIQSLHPSPSIPSTNQHYQQQQQQQFLLPVAPAETTIPDMSGQYNQTIAFSSSTISPVTQINPLPITGSFNVILPSSSNNSTTGTILGQIAPIQLAQSTFLATSTLPVSVNQTFTATDSQAGGQVSANMSSSLQQALQNLQQQQQQKQQQQQQLQMLLQHLSQQTQQPPQPPQQQQTVQTTTSQQTLPPTTPSAVAPPQAPPQTSVAPPTQQLGTHTSAPVLSALQSYLAGQGVISQSTGSSAVVSHTPPVTALSTISQAPVPSPSVSSTSQSQGPQIIICNNPSGQSQATSQFTGPSIVIMPGAGGPNNQMESLLRSILGSMIPPQQQQQSQQ